MQVPLTVYCVIYIYNCFGDSRQVEAPSAFNLLEVLHETIPLPDAHGGEASAFAPTHLSVKSQRSECVWYAGCGRCSNLYVMYRRYPPQPQCVVT